MGRALRITEGGFVYYVVCKGLDGNPLFRNEQDYESFASILSESLERWEPRLLAYALLPDQWHLLAVPRKDGDLSKWIAWITSVHAMRNKHLSEGRPTNGLYERRYRSFPVQDNQRLLDAILWIERLPLLQDPPKILREWYHTSFHTRKDDRVEWLSPPPVALPATSEWETRLAQGLDQPAQERFQYSIDRGAPYGDPNWVEKIAKRFRLETTLRPRGRPPAASKKKN